MAPPVLSKAKNGGAPRKMTFGQWLWPVLGVMSKVRGLRGTVIDPFGRSLERKMERQLPGDYEITVQRALRAMTPDNVKDVETLALLHERIRGYGHVKLANLSMVKRRERDLGAKLGIAVETGRYVQGSLDELKGAGALRGIPVVVAK
jgi:indolepyruvate ferredoxin oxidoreductase